MKHLNSGRMSLVAAIVCATFIVACDSDDDAADVELDSGNDAADTLTDGGDDTADVDSDGETGDDVELDTTPPTLLESLTAPGPFPVGYRRDAVAYAAPTIEGDRRMRLVIWYPAAEARGSQPNYFDIFPPHSRVYRNAPPANVTDVPLLVFSHGRQAYAEVSGYLAEHLASHGWVVASPDHTGDTFADGTTIDTTTPMLRPHDITATIDFMQDLPDDHPLDGMLGVETAVAGHSFGGYTAMAVGGATTDGTALLEACEEGTVTGFDCDGLTEERAAVYNAGWLDERVLAIIPMAGNGYSRFGDAGLANVSVPAFVMSADEDNNPTDGDPGWAAVNGPGNYRINILNAGHNVFTHVCDLGMGGDLGCNDDDIPSDDAFDIINAYALAFLRNVIKADATTLPILDGTIEVDSRAVLSVGE